ncbi:MAG: NAD(+) diphosphatase [Deltaproteobacteria bacterium]|nr:MAG: NAD(+) diphosphatase [Deltaproteobacteria bacterium]
MRFIPAVAPPSEEIRSAWWFVFRDDALLVKLSDETALIPCVADTAELDLRAVREQYLGTLDGRPCYSAQLPDDAVVPEGMTFRGLRSVFGLMEEDLFWIAGRAIQIVNWDQTHQYCGRCGSPTTTKSNERAKICPQCGLTSFPRISPAIIVAVLKENRILLARASHFPPGLYSVLAGFVEPGETFEDCVRRELMEEVGVEVRNISYFGSQPWPFPNSLMVAFTASYASGEVTVDKTEILDAGWFTAHDLPRIPDKISIARRMIDWFVEKYQ